MTKCEFGFYAVTAGPAKPVCLTHNCHVVDEEKSMCVIGMLDDITERLDVLEEQARKLL